MAVRSSTSALSDSHAGHSIRVTVHNTSRKSHESDSHRARHTPVYYPTIYPTADYYYPPRQDKPTGSYCTTYHNYYDSRSAVRNVEIIEAAPRVIVQHAHPPAERKSRHSYRLARSRDYGVRYYY
ncbi:hypothetical protein B7463_g7996, partial [Scytalidium lignicola]